MGFHSPDWTNIGFSFILLTVNLFLHPTPSEHGLEALANEYRIAIELISLCIVILCIQIISIQCLKLKKGDIDDLKPLL